MDEAGSVLDAHISGQHDRRDPIDERVAVLAVLEFPAAAAAHLGVVGDLPHGHHLGHQVRRQDRVNGPAGSVGWQITSHGLESRSAAMATFAGKVQGGRQC